MSPTATRDLPPSPAEAPPAPTELTDAGAIGSAPGPAAEPERAVPPLMAGLAALASTCAAAWMVGGIFRDAPARLVALTGALIGAGLVTLGVTKRAVAVLQYLALPVGAGVGVLLVAPDTGRGNTLASLVGDALHTGGLLQPPAPFEPGWKFLLVVLLALVGGGAVLVGVGMNRPRLGVMIPSGLTVAAALIQPSSAELVSGGGALLLVVVALGLAYGAELRADGHVSTGFELRRLGRAGLAATALLGVLALISNLGFLYPQPNTDRVVPAMRPQVPPQEPDRVLFTYTITQPWPLRLGVLDSYDPNSGGWLLPPYDPRRIDHLDTPASIPGAAAGASTGTPSGRQAGQAITARVTIADLHGHGLPAIAGLERVGDAGGAVTYDPRTGGLALTSAPVHTGQTYTLVGAPIPTGKQLEAAPAATGMSDFLTAGSIPPEVDQLLREYAAQARKDGVTANGYDRLQYLRTALYSKVVASGAGEPVDVPAAHVVAMLDGAQASPYEITAAEAILARWAGVPSRIGYGYYGGEQRADHSFEVHPSHGAMFLEVWFSGYGWVPVVGTPPRATLSTSLNRHNNRPNVHTSDKLALSVYVPVRTTDPLLLYEIVRWWAGVVGPMVLAGLVVIAGYPAVLKRLRRARRRRWARRHGLRARICVAYGELRDCARDLAVGEAAATPVELLGAIDDDAEHEELAWLVTRALWGDLRRDLREADVAAAERMARSVRRRLRRAQPAVTRGLALLARSSLRDPWSRELPNLWWELGLRRLYVEAQRRRRLAVRRVRRRARRLAWAGAATAAVSMLLAGCGGAPVAQKPLPRNLLPATLGSLKLVEEKSAEALYRTTPDSLVSAGRVYTVHNGDIVEGSVQVSVFLQPDVDTSDLTDVHSDACLRDPTSCTGHEVFSGIQASIGNGRFQRVYYHDQRAYTRTTEGETIYLWFPPRTQTMALLILRTQFGSVASEAVFHALLDHQNHRTPSAIPLPVNEPA